MSNQVYSNATEKYLTYPGFQDYTMSGVQNILAGATDTILFTTTTVNQQPQIVDLSASVFTFQETGIYSFRLNLGVTPNPAAGNFAFDLRMILTSTDARNATPLIALRQDVPAFIFTNNREYSLSYTGYMKQNDSVYVTYTNESNIPNVINPVTTSLIIARIY